MTRSILLLLLVIMTIACNSNTAGTSDPTQDENAEPATDTEEQASDYQANETLIAWVDLLNVRTEPNTDSKIVVSLRENAEVTYTGERTDELQTIELRATPFEEPWLKIRTADGKEGWVFGGAVQREGENKRVSRSTMSVGELAQLEMGQWTKSAEWESGAGDAENTTTIYKKGALTLAIRKTEVGEYGYSRTYDLYDKDYQLIKRRFIDWSGEHPSFSLTETITDLESNPAQTFKRSQAFSKHFFQLKPRPESVKGEFQEESLAKEEVASLRASLLVEAFGFKDIPSNVDTDGGCSCNFELSEAGTGMMIFASDMGDNAAMKINGKMIQLKDGLKAHQAELREKATQEVWITLKEKGTDELFGEEIDFTGDWQTSLTESLTEVMMTMESIPSEARIKSIGTVGMGHRANMRDLWNDAAAKAAKQGRVELELYYQGSEYRCQIKARQVSRNDGGGGRYEGYMELLSKDGTSLDRSYVYGDCGC
ncbi:MAG: SH3 domain-containing protein [Saprospiraceae bacterium]|nr:SH3 domain-containing protein [Saprospiraceae bacterium]